MSFALRTAALGAAALGLSACYEEFIDLESGEVPGGVVVEGISTTISGVVAKGFAYCDVIAREPVGTALSNVSYRPAGVVVGQDNAVNGAIPQPTAADVAFSLTVEDYAGPVVIEATNCTYEDETSSYETNISMLRTVIDIPETGGAMDVVVTPITEIAYNVAVARGGGLASGITSGGVEAAQRLVTNAFSAEGQFDPMSTIPAMATMEPDAGTSEAAIFHGLVLASFSGVGALMDELFDGLSDDLSSAGLREFYGILEDGAARFEESQRNRTGRSAVDVMEDVTAAALNPEA